MSEEQTTAFTVTALPKIMLLETTGAFFISELCRKKWSSSMMKGQKREVLSLLVEKREMKTKAEKRKGDATAQLHATLLVCGGDGCATEVMVVLGSGGRGEERK
ncbi:hypothetical protein HAX54_011024 [Datura stramonium]|uniref:Uncharacterized protein n=1 Tax=Datura stramonium TaxID=4076 RepID=A0ABS8RWV5_DATST|nr:hypothetical protein [Datura stramonium]